MTGMRSEKLSVMLTSADVARLDTYRQPRRWSRSMAMAVLIEQGLDRDQAGQEERRD